MNDRFPARAALDGVAQLKFDMKHVFIDAGPLQASAETTKHVPISPILGGVLLASGVVLLFMGNRRV